MTALSSAASAAARRMMSLSNALRRQPKVMISTEGIALPGQQRGVEAAFEGEGRRPGHHHVPVAAVALRAPEDVEIAAVELHRRLPFGQAAAMGGNQRGAGAAAAGARLAGAALPDAQ